MKVLGITVVALATVTSVSFAAGPPAHSINAMLAYATANSYTGSGLGETWNNRMQRSGFVGTFAVPAE